MVTGNKLSLCLQLRIRASDGDSPPHTAVQVFTATVDRNLEDPVFTKPSGEDLTDEETLQETESFERVIYKFSGKDEDVRVSIKTALLMFTVYK